MATTLARQQIAAPVMRSLPGRRFDHLFFTAIAWLMLITVFAGFAPSYYLAGTLAPRCPASLFISTPLFSRAGFYCLLRRHR